MRVVSSSSSENEHAAGRDAVEVYFDPEGRDSVADCLVREGYFVAHQTDSSEPQSQKVGTKVSATCKFGTGMKSKAHQTDSRNQEVRVADVGKFGTRMKSEARQTDSWNHNWNVGEFGTKMKSEAGGDPFCEESLWNGTSGDGSLPLPPPPPKAAASSENRYLAKRRQIMELMTSTLAKMEASDS